MNEPHDLDYTDTRAIRQHISVCMETGNHERARTVLRELKEFNYPASVAIRTEISRDYGTDL